LPEKEGHPYLFTMDRQKRSKYLNQIPLGRFGIPEDLVGIVLLLVSEKGNYITGQTIDVNGGMT